MVHKKSQKAVTVASLTLSAFLVSGGVFVFENQYQPKTEISADTTIQNVGNFAELQAAVKQGGVIKLTKDFQITQPLIVEKPIQLDGDQHCLKLDTSHWPSVNQNMFVIGKQGSGSTFKDVILDGNNQGRLFALNEVNNLTLTKTTVKNGTTQHLPDIYTQGVLKQSYQGGAIHALHSTLNLNDVTFENNHTKEGVAAKTADAAPHGGAIYSGTSNINITGGKFLNNSTGGVLGKKGWNGEGGAIKLEGGSHLKINQNQTVKNRAQTMFEGNHTDDIWDTGGRQGGSIEATDSEVLIKNTTFKITTPAANTGGAIKFENCPKAEVVHSYFEIAPNLTNVVTAGGAITTEGSNLKIADTNFQTGLKSYALEAGGLIQVVGSGNFELVNSTLTGSGVAWNASWKKTAKYGGAICFYDGSTVKGEIKNTKIQNFTSEISGAGIAIGTQLDDKRHANVNVTLQDTDLINNVTYAWNNANYGGGMFIDEGSTVNILGGSISSTVASATAGAIYNQGHLTISGGANISNNHAHFITGGIFNDGYLKVDQATINNNQETEKHHVLSKQEYGGSNIYAKKDVIITPRANITNGDVRVLDQQSAILLTGKLDKRIDVSVSEKAKDSKWNLNQKVAETQKRHVGYVIAKGIDGYQPQASDSEFLNYISQDTAQKVAAYTDHQGIGEWDFVLAPQKEVVLGQRAKMIYHANAKDAFFANHKATKEQLYTIYSSKTPWTDPVQMTRLAESQNPTRAHYKLKNWYQTAVTDENVLTNPTKNVYDFTNGHFGQLEQNTTMVTKIVNPHLLNVYAGWIKQVNVDYAFKSVTPGKDLPQSIQDLLPAAQQFDQGSDVNTAKITQKTIQVADGTWTLTHNWQKQIKKIMQDQHLVAEWKFTPKPIKKYQASYEFTSGTPGKTLPQTVLDLLPKSDSDLIEGSKYQPEIVNTTEIKVADGTWTLTTPWQKDAVVVKGDLVFKAVWTFKASKSDDPTPEPTKPNKPQKEKEPTQPQKETKDKILPKTGEKQNFAPVISSLLGVFGMFVGGFAVLKNKIKKN